jgi:hypothetical protein
MIGDDFLTDSSEELTRASDWRLKKCPDADSGNATGRLPKGADQSALCEKIPF